MKSIFQNVSFSHVRDLWHCGQRHAESKLKVTQTSATEQKLFFYDC